MPNTYHCAWPQPLCLSSSPCKLRMITVPTLKCVRCKEELMHVSACLLLLNISLHVVYTLIKSCLENQDSCWAISSKFLCIIVWIFMVDHFPIDLFPINLTFSIFQVVFGTSQNMKSNSTWKGAFWVVVGGSWLMVLSLWEYMGQWEQLTSGKTSTVFVVS